MYLFQSLATVLLVELILLASAGMVYFGLLPRYQQVSWSLPKVLMALGLGSAFLSYSIFGLMIFGLFNGWSLAALLLVWLLVGLGAIFKKRAILSTWLEQASYMPRWYWWLAAALLVLALANLLPALMPSVDWDGVAYHLALPKIYWQHQGFVFRPDIFHNLFPQFMEMLYSIGLITAFGQPAKVIHFEFGLMAAAVVAVLAKQLKCPPLWAGLAMLLFYGQYIVHIESGTTFVELAYTFYFLLGLMGLLAYRDKPEQKLWLVAAMVMFGITAAIKWHGLIILALGWAAAIMMQMKVRPLESKPAFLTRALGLGLIGGLPVLPYVIRNLWYTGNPIWPLGYGLFGGPFMDAPLAESIRLLHLHYAGVGHEWIDFIKLPWNLLWQSEAFSVGAKEFKWPLLGSMLLLLISFSLAVKKTSPARNLKINWWSLAWGGLVLIYLILWFASSAQFRFLLPLLPLWAIAVIKSLNTLWSRPHWQGKVITLVICGLLIAVHPPVHRDTPEQIKVLMGLKTPDSYCSKRLPHYQGCQFLNRFMTTQDKVLLFGENRGYYLDQSYQWGDPQLQKVIDFSRIQTAAELAEILQTQKINWVLYHAEHYPENYLPARVDAIMQSVLHRYGKLMHARQNVYVYQLHFMNVALLAERE